MVKKSKGTVSDTTWYALAAARILLGIVFLWAYFDKLFGLGFATKAAKAWVNKWRVTNDRVFKGCRWPVCRYVPFDCRTRLG